MEKELVQLTPNDEHNRMLASNVHPTDWINPTPKDIYHLVVVGAGKVSDAGISDPDALQIGRRPGRHRIGNVPDPGSAPLSLFLCLEVSRADDRDHQLCADLARRGRQHRYGQGHSPV